MKILEFCGENRLEIVEKCKIIKIWGMISIGQVKVSNRPAKLCAFGPKEKRFWKISRKFWDFFIKISMENWLSSHFLLNISWISDSSPKVHIYLWKIRPYFYNNFSYFGGGGTFQMFLHTGDASGDILKFLGASRKCKPSKWGIKNRPILILKFLLGYLILTSGSLNNFSPVSLSTLVHYLESSAFCCKFHILHLSLRDLCWSIVDFLGLWRSVFFK